MRIAREQMLCIVSPLWSQGTAPFASVAPGLDQLFADIGVVHFASVVLLPPGAGGNMPSLLLELAVDEGVRPHDLLSALAYHPGGALLSLYASYQPAGAPSGGALNAWLLRRLLADLSVADGGFIGPRDRTVAQIRQERSLYDAVRKTAPTLAPQSRNERALFAAALARSVRADNAFDWSQQPAPRSFWRSPRGRGKALFVGAVVGGFVMAVLLLLSAVPGLRCMASSETFSPLACLGVAMQWFVQANWRLAELLGGIAAGLVVYWLALLLPGLLHVRWHGWFDAIGRELDRPTDAWSARLTLVFAWLTLVAVLVVVSAAGAFVLAGPEAVMDPRLWQARPLWLELLVLGYALAFFGLVLVLAIGLRPAQSSVPRPGDGVLARGLKRFRRWLHRPWEQELQRAQQVHPAIERCEAALVGRTAHMVSLTDLRTPYAWSAFWTRLSLRVVTALGHVFFTEGRLGDAPGIQLSHWHIIDKGRRLLFCGNFDGTFGGYLDDFIKGASTGTTLFWRWSELWNRPSAVPGHPDITHPLSFAPTRLVLFRGVTCELRFKAYARASMLPHVYRFDALDLTCEQKSRATQLRDALCGERSDCNDDCIMRAIES